MNTPSGDDSANLAKQRLSRACRDLDRSTRLRWLFVVGEVLLLALLGLALADYWLILPLALRGIGALAWASEA